MHGNITILFPDVFLLNPTKATNEVMLPSGIKEEGSFYV